MIATLDFAVYYARPAGPVGGVRGYGYGRFGGEEGLRGVCNVKAVSRDRFPSLLSTAIPPRLDYPMWDTDKAWEFCKGIVALGYGEWTAAGVAWKVGGVWRLIKNG